MLSVFLAALQNFQIQKHSLRRPGRSRQSLASFGLRRSANGNPSLGLLLLGGLGGILASPSVAEAAAFPRPECHRYGASQMECFIINQSNGQIGRWSASTAERSSGGAMEAIPGAVSSLRSNAISCTAGQLVAGTPRACFYVGRDGNLKIMRRRGSSWIVEDLGRPAGETLDHGNNQLACLKYGGNRETLNINRACLVRAESGVIHMRRYTPLEDASLSRSTPIGWRDWETAYSGARVDIGNCVEEPALQNFCTLTIYGRSSTSVDNYRLVFYQEWPYRSAARSAPVLAGGTQSSYRLVPLSGRPMCLQGFVDTSDGIKRQLLCLGIGASSLGGTGFLSLLYQNQNPVGRAADYTAPFAEASGLNLTNVGSHAIQPNCVLVPPESSTTVRSHLFLCLQANGDPLRSGGNLELLTYNDRWNFSATSLIGPAPVGAARGTPSCVAISSSQVECVYFGQRASGRSSDGWNRISLLRSVGTFGGDYAVTALPDSPR
ncbi:MAG: hypothetical protein ACK587_15740 [Cyanobacteriota bacterium]